MGSGSSFCGLQVGENPYNLPRQRRQETGGSAIASEENLSLEGKLLEQDLVTRGLGGGDISGSKRQVDISSSHMLNLDMEKSWTTKQVLKKSSASEVDLQLESLQLEHDVRADTFQYTAGHAKTAGMEAPPSDEEIQEVVNKCWKDIGDSCVFNSYGKSSKSFDSRNGWKVVRLFVSSTFVDYHAEREVLVKKIVPELREWCEGRSIHLIECDLRWGVPKDFSTEATIRTCLNEIDRCLAETDGQPFFLNMLGERYGWIPCPSEISQEIQEEYQWIFPTSITHMEILHAAYRTQSQNAAFFIRSDDFLQDLPPEMMSAFVDVHPLNKGQLKALKTNIRERFPDQVFDYHCQYHGMDESSGIPKVKLKGLENFSENVVEFFKSAINRYIPVVMKQLPAAEIELSMHNHFIELRGQLVLGRSTEISTIMKYVEHGCADLNSCGSGADLSPRIVLACPGSGKSALMAHCTQEIRKLGLPLFYHFIGAGPGSVVPCNLMAKFVRWLKGFTAAAAEESNDHLTDEDKSPDMLKKEIKQGLDEISKREEVFIVIIDAINQLTDAEAPNHMDWLPSVFPRNVRCVISAVTDSRSSKLLLSDQYRTPPAVPIHLGELDDSSRQEIVKHTLGKYNKKLDAEQMRLLIGSAGASIPLWLSLACEELRVFGVFETVTQHIKRLPSTVKELLQLIINRLTNEDEHGNLRKVFGFLACSSGGLSETELQFLLSDDLTQPITMMRWAEVRRTLKPYVRNICGIGEEEMMEFFHASIQEVVVETLLADFEEKRKFHSKLADFFVDHCKNVDRVLLMAPEQLKLAGEKKRLLEFLRKDARSMNRSGLWKNNYYKYLRCDKLLSKGTPFVHDIHICQFCSMMRGAFGDRAALNKDSCIICGRWTSHKDDQRAAMTCHAHRGPLGPPNVKMCFVCRKPSYRSTVKAYLCVFCATMGNQNCAMLVGE